MDTEEREMYIDHALDSFEQMMDAYKNAKESHNKFWREYWNESVSFWCQSVVYWSKLANE